MIFKTIVLCLGLLTAAFSTGASAADTPEAFPNKPIRLVVPWAPGGFTDSLARLVAEQMGKGLGQPVIVENRPGANGIMGTESVAKATPDGYTLLMATAETHAEKSFPELMSAAARTPQRFKYASWGTGSTGHLAFELLNAPAHVEMIHVPYKGLGPALLDVIAGRVDMTLATILSSDQFVKANRLRPIAVTSPKRSPLMPAIPTISELGYPSYDVALWYGLVAPGATPAAVVNRLNAALREAVKDPAFRAKMAASDAEILVRSPEEFAAFLSRERVKWAGAARSAKVQLEQ
ncbi:MAG: hypothetical protein K0Q43_5745 [Ramlibacter sp.]|nr:hypothetical protein [Ramlibacter sp.]